MHDLNNSPLGKTTSYTNIYDASLLFPIARQMQRAGRGLTPESLPFRGDDVWYAYELSWLNARGKPEVALGKFTVPCDSLYLVESKSLKLYLNSFTGTKFASLAEVQKTLAEDMSAATQAAVEIAITRLSTLTTGKLSHFPGVCLDDLDIDCHTYTVSPQYLQCISDKVVTETLSTNLLKSNCLKTGQPDWGSLLITYTGKEIDKEGLLRYIVSLRNHNGFAEDCVEHIYLDILQQCAPHELTIEGRITRRGGLDINPLRSNAKVVPQRYAQRLWRQ